MPAFFLAFEGFFSLRKPQLSAETCRQLSLEPGCETLLKNRPSWLKKKPTKCVLTCVMLVMKKGSHATKNMPKRMPSVRLAFSAFLLCLLANLLLSLPAGGWLGARGTCSGTRAVRDCFTPGWSCWHWCQPPARGKWHLVLQKPAKKQKKWAITSLVTGAGGWPTPQCLNHKAGRGSNRNPQH